MKLISCPPFGTKWEGNDDPELKDDLRFAGPGALAPKRASDFAFIMHSLYHLKEDGVATMVCFPGILYREGAEKKIRKWLVDKNYIDAIIQLPENLFFGTSISTCILVLKKNENDNGILFINAKDLFIKSKIRNKLDDKNIELIYDTYQKREDKNFFSRVVYKKEIVEKDYSLGVDKYIFEEEVEEIVDIEKLNMEASELSEDVYKLNQYIDKLIQSFYGG